MLNIGICPGVGMSVIKPVLPPSQPNAARPVPSAAEAVQEEQSIPSTKAAQPAENKSSIKWWSNGSFSFKDIWDMINPLQHIPIISTLYRALTGDGIGGVARIIGGAIYGRAGGIGSMISSVFNAIIGAVTGKDIGERVYAAIFGDSKPSNGQVAVAQATAPKLPLLSAAPIARSAPADAGTVTYRPVQETPAPTAEQTLPATNGMRPLDSSRVLPNGLIFPQRQISYDTIAALDLYDRMAPVRVTALGKTDPEREEDSRFRP